MSIAIVQKRDIYTVFDATLRKEVDSRTWKTKRDTLIHGVIYVLPVNGRPPLDPLDMSIKGSLEPALSTPR